MSRTTVSERTVIIGLSAIAATTILGAWLAPGIFRTLPALLPDSPTYLEWHVGRTPGYPAFLSLAGAVSSSVGFIGWIQLALFLCAGAFLARSVQQIVGSGLAALAVGAGVMLHPQLVSYAFTVLPESMFVTTVMVHVALVMRTMRSARAGTLAIAGATLGLAILLKPVGYAFLPCLIVPVIGARWFQMRPLLCLVGPIVGMLMTVSIVNYATRGIFATQAQGGFSLIAQVGPFVDEDLETPYPRVTQDIARELADVGRALTTIDSLELYYLVSSHVYHGSEAAVRRHMGAQLERQGMDLTGERHFPAAPAVMQGITTIGSRIARATIQARPAIYARHVLAQLYGLWFLPLVQDRAEIDALQSRLMAIDAWTPAGDPRQIAFRRVPRWAFVAVRVVLWAALLTSLVALARFVRAPRLWPWPVLAYASAAVHANFLLVSAVQPGLPRYALVMWPLVAVTLVGTVAVIVKGLNSRPLGTIQSH